MFQGTGKGAEPYTHITISMGLRPRSGRKPIKIVSNPYIFAIVPVSRRISAKNDEIIVFSVSGAYVRFSRIPEAVVVP